MPQFEPIGTIRTPFESAEGTPIQSVYAGEAEGEVIVDEELAEGLDDIDGFDYVWLVYWWHESKGWKPHVVPFRDTRAHGVFTTRAPRRPNAIVFSVVRLLGRDGNVLRVAGVDVIDGTPLLDIKPYVPRFDAHEGRAGWLDDAGTERTRADDRFTRGSDR